MTRWQSASLGDVSQLISRGVAPIYVEGHGIAVLNQKCVRDHTINYEFSRRHDDGAKPVKSDRLIQKNDVLVNSTGTGTLGRVGLVREDPPEPTTVDTHVTIVRPKSGLFAPEFFGYMLIAIEEQLKAAGVGASGQTELARSVIENNFIVRYPVEKDEQLRLVELMKGTFSRLSASRDNTERNIANSKELFNSYLEKLFHGISLNSPSRPLLDLCDQQRGITYGVIKLGDHVDDGVPCLRTSNVRRLYIDHQGMKRISHDLSSEYSRTVLKGGEILVNVRGTLGGVVVVPDYAQGWNVSREVAVAPVDNKLIDPEFVGCFIASPLAQRWLAARTKGAAYVGINLEDLRLLPIPVPKRQTQEDVVEEIKSVFDKTQALERCYIRKIETIDNLHASFLRHSFSGAM